jgi:tRNA(Ile)-lysidine synthase
MPREAVRDGIVWARPWLEQPRAAIEAYVRRYRLSFVEDPSNADCSLARNRLRQQVWPTLSAGFDHACTSLAASARRAHEAADSLRELAALDALQVCADGDGLGVVPWLALSPARRANLLRAWLSSQGEAGVPETLVQRLLRELPAAVAGAAWPWHAGDLRLHAGHLRVVPARAVGAWLEPIRLDLSRAGHYAVPPWRGAFEVSRVTSGGLTPDRLRRCELRGRVGAEQFQRSRHSVPRSLKKQFQAAGVPQWQRDGPLLYVGNTLLYVPGLGIDARVQAEADKPMLGLRWLSDDGPAL